MIAPKARPRINREDDSNGPRRRLVMRDNAARGEARRRSPSAAAEPDAGPGDEVSAIPNQ
jgi:hypothetical protein